MVSRRSFLGQVGAFLPAAPLLTEAVFAREARAAQAVPAQMTWLDANENPLGPPAAALAAIRAHAGEVGRYHMQDVPAFAAAIAASENIKPGQLTIGVGSSDVITAAICAFASEQRPFITAAPSYDVVVQLARKLGRQVTEIALTAQWAYPVRELIAAAQTAGGGLIYLVNPNNPTSSLTADADIDWLVDHLPPKTVLFVDEAYLEFVAPEVAQSAIRHVHAGRNVVVSRTFSKIYGMAGARAGFGCASAELTVAMNDFMDNIIPVLGMRAASAALAGKRAIVAERRAINTRVRTQFCDWLRSQKISFIEPHANFVMVDVAQDVKNFSSAMHNQGVAVGRQFPPLNNMCRVTIGTDAEMQRFREAFRKVRSAAA